MNSIPRKIEVTADSNSRLAIGLFIFNKLRKFSALPFVNFLPVRSGSAIL